MYDAFVCYISKFIREDFIELHTHTHINTRSIYPLKFSCRILFCLQYIRNNKSENDAVLCRAVHFHGFSYWIRGGLYCI